MSAATQAHQLPAGAGAGVTCAEATARSTSPDTTGFGDGESRFVARLGA